MLNSVQRSYLGALASKEPALIQLGKAGASEALVVQLKSLLERHELVKLKFMDFKGEKREISTSLALSTGSELVRILGNTAIFYKSQPDPGRRRILLPAD
ncbi:MAG: YhbY family RNA-binding protein [Treponema sp.]|jgi:RNA-binding protein|nr:YhbY family RNA-binding protein [Treponema sp.]